MKYLRHDRHAEERWEYDATSRVVIAYFANGVVFIPVCTQRHPRVGAFFLNRRDEDQWVISPAKCVDNGKGYTARNVPYDADGVHCEFITLSGAPAGVNNLLGDLYEAPDDDTPTSKMCPQCDAKGYTPTGECSLCRGQCAVSFGVFNAWLNLE